MSDGLSKLKLYITTIVMTFMGILSVHLSFLNTFYKGELYDTAIWFVLVLFSTAGFSAAVVFMKHKWIVPVCCIIIAGIFVYTKLYEITGGFGICFNIVAEAAAKFFQADVLYIYMTTKMIKYGETETFCYMLAVLLPLIFSYTIYHRKTIVFTILIVVAALGIPVLFEVFPGFFDVLFAIIYCIQLLVISVVPGKISDKQKFTIHIAALIFGMIIMLAGGIVNIVLPSDEYERSSVFDDIKTFLVDHDFPEWSENKSVAGTIGAGKLGHVDELKFQGAEILKVELPALSEKIYIKGYVGATYDRNQWKEPSAKDKELFADMLGNGYPQQTMVSEFLEQLAAVDELSGYKAEMKISYLSSFKPYHFIPLYSVMSEGLTYNTDKVISLSEEDVWIEYFIPDEESFRVHESLIGSIWEDTPYESLNERYEEYVYENYLDVNTTVKNDLRDKWGSYSISTGADRFELAKDIQKYLEQNYTYTTSPGKLPEGEDFVKYFLYDTKKGYCTYFATAAVMMFRSAGVPARYVEGYVFYSGDDISLTGQNSVITYSADGASEGLTDYGEITVKDYNAHAWVEFYVDGIGWIDYEVTPGSGTAGTIIETESQSGTTTQETTTTEPATDETTSYENATTKEPDLNPTTEVSQEATTGGETETGFSFKLSAKTVKLLVIIFAVLLLIALIVFSIIISHSRINYSRETIHKEDKKNLSGKSIIMYYGLFERLMRKCGFKKTAGMTYMDFALLVEKECYAVGENEGTRLTEIFEKLNYSNMQVTVDEIDEMKRIYLLIKQRVYENMGVVGKIIFTYISNY